MDNGDRLESLEGLLRDFGSRLERLEQSGRHTVEATCFSEPPVEEGVDNFGADGFSGEDFTLNDVTSDFTPPQELSREGAVFSRHHTKGVRDKVFELPKKTRKQQFFTYRAGQENIFGKHFKRSGAVKRYAERCGVGVCYVASVALLFVVVAGVRWLCTSPKNTTVSPSLQSFVTREGDTVYSVKGTVQISSTGVGALRLSVSGTYSIKGLVALNLNGDNNLGMTVLQFPRHTFIETQGDWGKYGFPETAQSDMLGQILNSSALPLGGLLTNNGLWPPDCLPRLADSVQNNVVTFSCHQGVQKFRFATNTRGVEIIDTKYLVGTGTGKYRLTFTPLPAGGADGFVERLSAVVRGLSNIQVLYAQQHVTVSAPSCGYSSCTDKATLLYTAEGGFPYVLNPATVTGSWFDKQGGTESFGTCDAKVSASFGTAAGFTCTIGSLTNPPKQPRVEYTSLVTANVTNYVANWLGLIQNATGS